MAARRLSTTSPAPVAAVVGVTERTSTTRGGPFQGVDRVVTARPATSRLPELGAYARPEAVENRAGRSRHGSGVRIDVAVGWRAFQPR